MTNISLIDTGYARVDNQSSDTPETEIANSGTELELKGVKFTFERAVGIDDTTEPDRDEDIETNYISRSNPKVIIEGVLKQGDFGVSVGENSDVLAVKELDKMATTKGIKCVYYNDDTAGGSTTGYKLLTKAIGVNDYDAGGTTFVNHPVELHIHVRFNKFRVIQSSDGTLLKFTLEGVMTE